MAQTIQQLSRKLSNAITRGADALETKAQLVSVDQDGRSSFRVIGETNKVWIQLYGGGPEEIHEAYNTAVKAHDGMFVFVRKDGNDYYVVRQAPREATDYLGEAAGSFATPDKIGELTNSVLPDRNYGAGRVTPLFDPAGSDADLTVQVAPFFYRYFGQWLRWPGGTGDLTAYLPVTATYWQWALVCIWGFDNTIVVVTGIEYADYTRLTDSTLADLSADIEGLVPTDAVKLQAGATTIERENYFQHGRPNAAEIGLSADPIVLPSLYHHLPANRRASWQGPITLTGDLIIEGELTVA